MERPALTDRMHTESDVLNVRVAAGDFIAAAQGMASDGLVALPNATTCVGIPTASTHPDYLI